MSSAPTSSPPATAWCGRRHCSAGVTATRRKISYRRQPNAESTAHLYFTDSVGHRLVVQVPAALHWSDAQIGQFGAAVHANANAEAGVGRARPFPA